MRQILLPAYLILLCLTVPLNHTNAQISITEADMPVEGSVYTMAYDTSGTWMPLNASPTAQTWNYSTLANSESNSYGFVNSARTPYYAHFHSSNIADTLFYAPGYTFYSLTPSAFSETGFVTTLYSLTAGINLHPYFQQITFPATYGTIDGGISYGDSSMAIAYAGIDSGRAKVQITYWDTVDAFGAMTTPFGTDSVIRQRHYDYTIDSIFTHSTVLHKWAFYQARTIENNQYRWYAKGIPYYFALMQLTNNTAKDSIMEWYDGVAPLAVNNISHSALTKVYPNPATNEINFNCSSPDAKYVSVFDIAGRQISTHIIKNSLLSLNVTEYAAGMYIYRVSDAAGNILDRGKFSVQ